MLLRRAAPTERFGTVQTRGHCKTISSSKYKKEKTDKLKAIVFVSCCTSAQTRKGWSIPIRPSVPRQMQTMGGANISFRPRWQNVYTTNVVPFRFAAILSPVVHLQNSCTMWNKNRNGIFFFSFFCGKVIDDFEPGEERIFFSFGLLTASMSKITLSIKSGRKKMASLIHFWILTSTAAAAVLGLVNIYHQLRMCIHPAGNHCLAKKWPQSAIFQMTIDLTRRWDLEILSLKVENMFLSGKLVVYTFYRYGVTPTRKLSF